MQKLVPYQAQLPLQLEADLVAESSQLRFNYKLNLLQTQIAGLPEKSLSWTGAETPRKDLLWTSTCFEAFLKPQGSEAYYELNFSLQPAWNAYEFQSYRHPQPPTFSSKFSLKKMTWNSNTKELQVEVEHQLSVPQFQIGLAAVLEDSGKNKHYYALAHPSSKPDFHAADCFVLKRGNPL